MLYSMANGERTMESMGKMLQHYRKLNNLTQAEVAKRMGELGYPIKNGAVSTWEKGSSIPNANQFLTLCRILGITDIYNTFVGDDIPGRKIPLRLIGVSAGGGEYVGDESVDDYIVTTEKLATYALRINGDSMEPLYDDNDIVLVQRTEILENGDVGIFYLDGDQYCKRLQNNWLMSENKNYSPIDISNSDCFRILGKVIGKYGK